MSFNLLNSGINGISKFVEIKSKRIKKQRVIQPNNRGIPANKKDNKKINELKNKIKELESDKQGLENKYNNLLSACAKIKQEIPNVVRNTLEDINKLKNTDNKIDKYVEELSRKDMLMKEIDAENEKLQLAYKDHINNLEYKIRILEDIKNKKEALTNIRDLMYEFIINKVEITERFNIDDYRDKIKEKHGTITMYIQSISLYIYDKSFPSMKRNKNKLILILSNIIYNIFKNIFDNLKNIKSFHVHEDIVLFKPDKIRTINFNNKKEINILISAWNGRKNTVRRRIKSPKMKKISGKMK